MDLKKKQSKLYTTNATGDIEKRKSIYMAGKWHNLKEIRKIKNYHMQPRKFQNISQEKHCSDVKYQDTKPITS